MNTKNRMYQARARHNAILVIEQTEKGWKGADGKVYRVKLTSSFPY